MNITAIPGIADGVAQWAACVVMALQVPKDNFWLYVVFCCFGSYVIQKLEEPIPTRWVAIEILLDMACIFITMTMYEKTDIYVRIYHASKAFTYATFVASLSWQTLVYLGTSDGRIWSVFLPPIIFLVLYSVLFLILYYAQQNSRNRYANLNVSPRTALTGFVIMFMIFAISNTGYVIHSVHLLSNSSSIFMMRTFADLCGILLFNILENQRYETYLRDDL